VIVASINSPFKATNLVSFAGFIDRRDCYSAWHCTSGVLVQGEKSDPMAAKSGIAICPDAETQVVKTKTDLQEELDNFVAAWRYCQ
jgi:hypothetical protein